MLFGHVSSGRFSLSPGRSKILSLFFTSSVRSFAAFESSSRSLRMISFKGDGAETSGAGAGVTAGVLPSAGLPSTGPPEGMGVGVIVGVDTGEKHGVEESELFEECEECECKDDDEDVDG